MGSHTGPVIVGTRTLRSETGARNHNEAHFKGIALRMYQKCKALGAYEFDLQGAIVNEASSDFMNVLSIYRWSGTVILISSQSLELPYRSDHSHFGSAKVCLLN